MLIKQLLEHTPTQHIDFTDLSLSLEKIKGITYEINFMKRKESSVKTIHELESKISGTPFKIAFPSRVFIWKGELFDTFKPSTSIKVIL